MKTLGSVLLGAACIALLLAPSAQAHKLTVKRAEAALRPPAAETVPQVAPKIAAKLPGATIAKTGVACEVTKRKKERHRAECIIAFSVAGASTGETVCTLSARVQFRGKKSKELKVSIYSDTLGCFFLVE